jgi:hypothetical protein
MVSGGHLVGAAVVCFLADLLSMDEKSEEK